MTNDQISRGNMFRTVILLSLDNLGIVNNLPEYPECLKALQDILVAIQAAGTEQKRSKTWITKQKNRLQAELVDQISDTARKLTTFARFTKNQPMMGEVDMNESDFKRLAASELKDYAQIIYDWAQSFVDQLAKYEITVATQAALLDLINEFNAILGDPRLGILTKSQSTEVLVDLYAAGDGKLADMDAAVEIVRKSQPIFYNAYHAARRIIATGAGKLSLKLKVLDAETGEPIKGALVSIAFESNSKNINEKKVVLERKTAQKGGINVKSLGAGTYLVTFRKAGYTDLTVVININDGEMTVLNVNLVKK